MIEYPAPPNNTTQPPTEIRLKSAEKILEVDFPGGVCYRFPAELLRVESPSAEVQGHAPGQKQTPAGRAHVGIIGVQAVGNYAVRITFDDMHDSGIYTWDYFFKMGPRIEEAWNGYLADLEAQGLSREP